MKNNNTAKATITIHATAEQVWDALTTPEIIKQYFFGTNAISDWKEGSPIIFKGEWEGKSYEDKGTILVAEAPKLFRYSYWSSMSGLEDRPENYFTITYELFENEGDTMLTVTQENIRDEKVAEHTEENWRKVLNDMKALLERVAALSR
ncbi:MAG: hypothetical protein JWP81_5241 [Ferruginibacter sp.]|nr:hypothetical protein [Ferruginibacter sp.]